MAVFVSHSSRYQDFVRRLVADLGRAGIEAWTDQDELRAGQDLAVIDATIGESEALVVVVSAAAAGSAWVRREVAAARSLNVRVLPALLEDAPPNWAPGVDDLAFADFRRVTRYRRGLHNLIASIQGVPDRGRPMGAKEAAALVKEEFGPIGDLCGISHQGVASLYHLANARDSEFADVMDGTSRYWVVEFFDRYISRMKYLFSSAVSTSVFGYAYVYWLASHTGERFTGASGSGGLTRVEALGLAVGNTVTRAFGRVVPVSDSARLLLIMQQSLTFVLFVVVFVYINVRWKPLEDVFDSHMVKERSRQELAI